MNIYKKKKKKENLIDPFYFRMIQTTVCFIFTRIYIYPRGN